jgi:hypothetical protein
VTIFPILTRGWRSVLFIHWLRRQRFGGGLSATLLLVALMVVERWKGISVAGMMSVVPFASIGPITLMVIGLNAGGFLLSVERREGTLPLLLLTRLTSYDIVLGKLLQAIVLQVHSFLVAVPVLVMPLLASGIQPNELWLITLGCLNVLFFGLALGLLGSVLGEGRNAAGLCLVLLSPWFLFSTGLGRVVPAGIVHDGLAALQCFNPCDVLLHVQSAAVGFRPGVFWWTLLGSHVLGWSLVALTGRLLPSACRRQSGVNAGLRLKRWWRPWSGHLWRGSAAWRTRMLNRNPFYWLTSRERWRTPNVWLWLVISAAGWSWLVWIARGAGVTMVLVMGAAGTWHIALYVMAPPDASRCLVEDRQSGALEMLLCTPLSVNEIVRGQWLTLYRRYLPPLVAVLLIDVALMTAGYVTFGFGGMLDPEDRGLWLFGWSSGILLLPVWLAASCWVAMRRAMRARDAREGGGVAILQICGLIGLGLFGLFTLAGRSGDNPSWWWWKVNLVLAAHLLMVIVFGWRARRIFLGSLREAAAGQYFIEPAADSRPWIRVRWPWPLRRQSSPTP